ncbi:MAG: TetR/AcrR family transcriptional regulator, repressor of the mexAB-oprM multidrug resistance operon [Solirubrobacteraceae bacterium]|nr:TetR/AcrR family transcriptional regulator, repressor of the mexAB-oprM multidrug resistance operon [Solirubrobacteraceae bacterium]
MPKTRTGVPRAAKVEEILGVAERRLRSGGYESLSIAAIARELGLAQNAIYWYFASKDHLFVAVLEQMLGDIAARKPARSGDRYERVLWFTDQFAVLWGLRGAMAERARRSRVVAEFVENLDVVLSRMLTNAFRDHVREEQLPIAVRAFRATVEGTFVEDLDRSERRKVLTFTLERLLGPAAPREA